MPSDWCYVNNFSNEYAPKAIKLPSGKAKVFQKDMKSFVEAAKNALRRAFENEDYEARRETTIKQVESKRKQLIEQLNTEAQREGLIIKNKHFFHFRKKLQLKHLIPPSSLLPVT